MPMAMTALCFIPTYLLLLPLTGFVEVELSSVVLVLSVVVEVVVSLELVSLLSSLNSSGSI